MSEKNSRSKKWRQKLLSNFCLGSILKGFAAAVVFVKIKPLVYVIKIRRRIKESIVQLLAQMKVLQLRNYDTSDMF